MPTPLVIEDDILPHHPLSDYDKIKQSLSTITSSISSLEDVLSMFGLSDMPRAQRLGIYFGVLTFALTMCAILTLLTLGGTWRRIEQQSRLGGVSACAPDGVSRRRGRALLMDRLLDMRDWMMEDRKCTHRATMGDDATTTTTTSTTPLTRMLMMAGPPTGGTPDVFGYMENYKAAYLRCQDVPGGG